MRVENVRAEADLVGRRVRVGWDLVPGEGEDLADAPRLRLRGKRHDFQFPAPDDDFVVYDSAAFPPPGTLLAAEVERAPTRDGDLVTEHLVETVSAEVEVPAGPPGNGNGSGAGNGNGPATVTRTVEVLRRSRWTTRDRAGTLVRRREEVLDVGGGHGLPAGETRYYELTRPGPSGSDEPAIPGALVDRAVVTPTEAYRDTTARRLYEQIPAAYRRHDVVGPPGATRAPGPAIGHVPESTTAGGQLRRFLDPIGLAVDQLRSRAEQLRGLHDVADVDARYLPHLAATVGWDLARTAPIPAQRHEIRFASTLYRLTGTLLGCKIWVKRLTGWDAEIVELWRNVLFSNDLGSGLASDHGSRTVDTDDAELLASMGGPGDRVDYVHDSRTTQDARYALNAIGIFVTPPAEDLADVTGLLAKRDRLLANTALYLPLNLRAVVVLDLPTDESTGDEVLGFTASTDTTDTDAPT